MERELRFGLDLGQLAVLKKRVWVDYEQLLRVFFHDFKGKIFFFLFLKHRSVRTKKLNKIKLNFFFLFLKTKKYFFFGFLYTLEFRIDDGSE